MADSQNWEYRVITTGTGWNSPKDEELEQLLNELGTDGWEVITVHNLQSSNKVRVITKRPLSLRTRRQRSMPTIEN